MFTKLASLAVLGSLVAAAPSAAPAPDKVSIDNVRLIQRQNSGVNANCRSFHADVTASTEQNIDLASVIGGPPPNQQVLTQASIDQFAAGSTVMQQIGNATKIPVNGTYSIYFEYCEPKNGQSSNSSKIFQTHHGLVGNAGYWNVQLDNSPNNSFAESAAAAGWSTLSYDRLGVGQSAKPDGTNVVQISYEIAQSVAIAQALRSGNLSDVGQFGTVVGVGHSYGSNLLTGVASIAPEAFDALVLTGFTNNATMGPLGLFAFQSTIANVAYPNRFASDANDYVITPSKAVDQTGFFHYPNYTNSSLDFFTNNKGEYTLGQQNTIAVPIKLSRTNFTKPVFVVTGEYDAPYCAANCSVTSLTASSSSNSSMSSSNSTSASSNSSSTVAVTQLDTAKDLFPGVTAFDTYVVPDTAHGINYHTTAYQAYQQIINFVSGQGL
ncbi:hypothetical protein I316_06660 [Kwoniella heveanensis BCC8398]|uniref:AB hydrolase-1 domain-containing protein n=1 Tax=Kwoniella heveanensis BCC8398 TaxID=1296120 RepID=A0A1B9GL38_9TREE|nr:hypothetical protein I316_06660 [Kwoniella heveanensis BCC8398]